METSSNLTLLPPELIRHIGSYLEYSHLSSLGQSCKTIRNAIFPSIELSLEGQYYQTEKEFFSHLRDLVKVYRTPIIKTLDLRQVHIGHKPLETLKTPPSDVAFDLHRFWHRVTRDRTPINNDTVQKVPFLEKTKIIPFHTPINKPSKEKIDTSQITHLNQLEVLSPNTISLEIDLTLADGFTYPWAATHTSMAHWINLKTQLLEFKNLSKIELYGSYVKDPSRLRNIHLPLSLRELYLTKLCHHLPHDTLITMLKKTPKLRVLSLKHTHVSLSNIPKLPELNKLNLSGNGEATDEDLITLLQQSPKIEILKVKGRCCKITLTGMEKPLKSIRILKIKDNQYIIPNTTIIHQIRQQNPLIQIYV